MDKEIKVSVYCLTYNHEKYISQTLEGFINQKTDFAYEVFVHDDASTDGTAVIVAEFAEKYPEIIKPIYQKENQYSKKINIVKTFIVPLIKGEYIAMCEGDDYWCSPDKLQRQVEILDTHPECTMVSHNTQKITENGEFLNNMVMGVESGYLDPEGLICKTNRNPHFSSLMYRTALLKEEKPDFFRLTTGDNSIRLFALTKGKIYYINEVMSSYRVFTPNGWTDRQQKNRGARIQTAQNMIAFLCQYDVYTDGKFHDAIEREKQKRMLSLKMAQGEHKEAYELSKKLQMPKGIKICLYLASKFPFLVTLRRRLLKLK